MNETIDDAAAATQRRFLALLYSVFRAEAQWPLFQYVSARTWRDLGVDPRDIYYQLSAAGLVWPSVDRDHGFNLRADTRVALSLLGMTGVKEASEDSLGFVFAVRFIAERATQFLPTSPTAVEELRVTGDEVAEALNAAPDSPAVVRQGWLLRDQGGILWTSFAGSGADSKWSLAVDIEQARRFLPVTTVSEYLAVQGATRAEGAAPWANAGGIQASELVDAHSSASDAPEDLAGEGAMGPSQSRSASREGAQPPGRAPQTADEATEGHDVFISHAGEDKVAVARPLAQRLQNLGYRVWFDEFELKVGSRLRRSIDVGLANSRFGVVVLSPAFFGKEWPERELDGLVAKEGSDLHGRILPVWHEVDKETVAEYSPILADRVAARTSDGLDAVIARLADALGPPATTDDAHAEMAVPVETMNAGAPGPEADADLRLRLSELYAQVGTPTTADAHDSLAMEIAEVEARLESFSASTTVQLRVHEAVFVGDAQQRPHYFLNVYNASRTLTTRVTHVWFETEPQAHVLTRRPGSIPPGEQWETWLAVSDLPPAHVPPAWLARVRLADGSTVCSVPRRDVPAAGFIPG
jgi:hypothetical protein